MNTEAEIRDAIEIIGAGHTDDWKIDPESHADSLGEKASELVTILRRTEVARTATEYNAADKEADMAQEKFKGTAERANRAVLATACVGAAVMILGILSKSTNQALWFAILGTAGVATGALAAMWLAQIRDGEMLRRWTENRARAESQRLEYFATIINFEPERDVRPEDKPTHIRLDLLKLEYFRRYLLDSQLAFYDKRSGEHRTEADKRLNESTLWTCAATVLTGAAGLLAVRWSYFAALAGGGIATAAVATMLTNTESVNRDRSNAQRYVNTGQKLVDISKQLTATREMVASGQNQALKNFYDASRDILMAEHSQWLEESKRRNSAIERLETQLSDLKKKLDEE
jgi:hypothetical protein